MVHLRFRVSHHASISHCFEKANVRSRLASPAKKGNRTLQMLQVARLSVKPGLREMNQKERKQSGEGTERGPAAPKRLRAATRKNKKEEDANSVASRTIGQCFLRKSIIITYLLLAPGRPRLRLRVTGASGGRRSLAPAPRSS